MKIGFFITARLKSSRLKQKILLDLNGKPVIDRVIERAKKVVGIDGVVLCTSTNSQDSVLYENALSNQIQFYTGSENDVLQRLLNAAEYYHYDAFVSITADNPLFSVYTSQLAVDWYIKERFDFIFPIGFPIGIGAYFIDTKALKVACHMKKESDTEIWGPFVNRSDFFNIGEMHLHNPIFNERIRLTCDFLDDYYFISKIYSCFDNNRLIDIFQILQLLKNNPEYLKINAMHKQIQVEPEKVNHIKREFDKNKDLGFNLAKKINKELKPGRTTYRVNL